MKNDPNTQPVAWWRAVDAPAWRALFGAGVGWMLDAMDVMLYTFAVGAIQGEFKLSTGGAGAMVSAMLLASAFGGAVSGVLADRFGRVRMLFWSVLFYSVFTALTAAATTIPQLVACRLLVGLGLGGEWSAGAVLVAETWPARHRGKGIGIMQAGWAVGCIAAALLARFVLPHWGWRPLFAIGIAPALLALWVRASLKEPEAWKRTPVRGIATTGAELLTASMLRRVVPGVLIGAALLSAYWGLFTWVPAFLARPPEQGGAGLGLVKSTSWIIPMQVGAFAGYTSFGFFADRFGRRRTFLAFVVGAAIVVMLYGLSVRSEPWLMVFGPLVGFFGHGYFSVFGAMLAELFPSRVRGAAAGVCYNLGRAASAAAPWLIGAIADARGMATGLGATAGLFLAGGVLVFLLPETRAKELE